LALSSFSKVGDQKVVMVAKHSVDWPRWPDLPGSRGGSRWWISHWF